MGTKTALFAAGCFWGVEEAFRKIAGVADAVSGYSGGDVPEPTYEHVCSGETGHAETVRVEYDPEQVSYEELVRAFFAMHDPTQENQQGADVGEQYRSAIFYQTAEERETAERVKNELDESGRYDAPIATAVEPAKEFYKAEEYHQRYYEKQGR